MALLALVVLVAAGCARPVIPEKPVSGGTITLGLLRAPGGVFRPLVSEERDSAVVSQLMYSGLLRTGPQLEPICDLCADFTISADQRTVTFHLRKDVLWHDGKPFTAEDVVFTYQAMLAPEYSGPHTGKLTALRGARVLLDERDAADRDVAAGKISMAEGAARKAAAWKRWLDGPGRQAMAMADAYTVSFSADTPYAPLFTALMLPIAPAHTQEAVGTGPFKLMEFRKGEYLKLVRHEPYHLGKPYAEAAIARVVPPGKALEMLQAGSVDYVPLSAEEASNLVDGQPISLVEWPSAGYQYLGLNHDRPPFSDSRVRQALMYGINRRWLVDELLHGHGAVVNTHVTPGHWAAPEGLNGYPYDPGKAATLLAEAGWSALDAAGYRVRDGHRLQFTLVYPKGNPVREASAAMIQRNLRALGVKADLQLMEFGRLIREVFGQRQVDAWLLGWDLGRDPDPGPVFSPDNKWGQVSGWSSERSEELILRGRQAMAVSERKPVYAEWLKLLNEELPYLFLYVENEVAGVRSDRLRGVKADARGALWNVWEWWIPEEKQ